MKKYDELRICPHQFENIWTGVERHDHGLEDCKEIIRRSVTSNMQDDLREQFWGRINGKGILVTVSAGVSDKGSVYGTIVTAYEAPKPKWWFA